MELAQILGVKRGITAIIGSGGKTTLMLRLAEQLSGKVVVCTTTKIFVPDLPVCNPSNAAQLQKHLQRHPLLCVGTPTQEGKLTAPILPMETIQAAADYVLVEADGSKHLPLKAHLPHEPVIPPQTGQKILLVGAQGFGHPIAKVAHRWEVFCQITGKTEQDTVLPQDVATVILEENMCDAVVVNPLESDVDWAYAAQLAAALPQFPVYGAALQHHICRRIIPMP